MFSLTANARNQGESKGDVECLGNCPTPSSEVRLFRVLVIRDIRSKAASFQDPSLLKEICVFLSEE